MEVARTFLESSTIHGVEYILSTRKTARLFWIMVVTFGFTGAVLLIRASFQTWAESPVKTTIKTLPISEITLPKLTVCPPKNTFTDMNYDIMRTENRTLTENLRNEMFNFALTILHENNANMDTSLLIESDRYYNWYHGYTKVHDISTTEYYGLRYKIYTSATKGLITTQYYGKPFELDLVERKVFYNVYVYPPQRVKDFKNVTLHFKLDKFSMSGSNILDRVKLSRLELSDAMTTAKTNFTPPGSHKSAMSLMRHITNYDIKTIRLDVMPGFKFSWWYTCMGCTGNYVEILPEPKYKDEGMSTHFKRYLNHEKDILDVSYFISLNQIRKFNDKYK